MELDFYKYQGTGNDFILIDNRGLAFPKKNTSTIEWLCDRRFGIGGDGLILLENDKIADFRMVYYNSDGNESSMCGNGGRCISAFAHLLGVIENESNFVAVDGPHHATINDDGIVSLQMSDVSQVKITDEYSFLNTGSPHHVLMVDHLETANVKSDGATIRYSALYGKDGSNVNFVTQIDYDSFAVRTYERGVEDETLSCGTGVTAVAIAMHASGKTKATEIKLKTPGGELSVSFETEDGKYHNVHLTGPATLVFKGTITI